MLLGQKTPYKDTYDNTILYPIARSHKTLKMSGFDFWNCYEFSWLNTKNKPIIRLVEFIVPASSRNIVESKSVKLYLNSFHNTKFEGEEEVIGLIQNDLNRATGTVVSVKLRTIESYINSPLTSFTGIDLDFLDITIKDNKLNKDLLKLENNPVDVQENLYSNLFKANCLITGQPDWGSIMINYQGKKIDHTSLLKYLISFRSHNEFAEPAAENIFTDIMERCACEKLTVYLRFTRRGGIDINPIRSSHDLNVTEIDNLRHVRQ